MSAIVRNVAVMLIMACALLVNAGPAAAACADAKRARDSDVLADTVQKLFNEKKYKQLDALAEKYEKEKTATLDRVSALSAFYHGIEQDFTACSDKKMTDSDWEAHGAALIAWQDHAPRSRAAQLAIADHMSSMAWRVRGSGFASGVGKDNMARFKAMIATSRERLEQIESVNKNNPAWYSAMMPIALAQGWPPAAFEALFEKAAKLDPYYLDIHYQHAQFYDEHWYGNTELLRRAIERSTVLTHKKLGQIMYARLYAAHHISDDDYKRGAVDWKKMKAGYEQYIKLHPENALHNGFAYRACMAGDLKTAKEQLDIIGDKLVAEAWKSPVNLSYCVAAVKNMGTGKKTECFERADDKTTFCR